jgi:hypothetical protein
MVRSGGSIGNPTAANNQCLHVVGQHKLTVAPTIIIFKLGKFDSLTGREPRIGEPWVYVWVDPSTKKALYVGEAGKSGTYNLTKRLRFSIGELAGGTREQVKQNAQQTGYNLKNGEVHVYAFRLPRCCRVEQTRRHVESWLHWLITVRHREHHERYFGFSYHVPDNCYLPCAERAYVKFAKSLTWVLPLKKLLPSS